MILALTSKTRTTSEMYDLASTVLAQKVAQVTGVGDVTVGGGSLPAVRVELQPYALMQYGISLDEVRRSIAAGQPAAAEGRGRGRDALLAGPGQRPADPGEAVRAAHRHATATAPRSGCRTSPRSPTASRIASTAATSTPTRRCCSIISRQPDANIIETVDAITARDAGPARLPARRRRPARGERPLAGHPRHPARGGAIAVHRGRAGHRRRAAVPGQPPRRDHPGRGGAGVAHRQLRGDVPVGLLAEQPVADGAGRRHRPGRRRRHRRAREHLAARREGRPADGGRADRRQRGRLDAAVDEPGHRRRLRLAAVHGRHRREAVPRVLDHAGRGDPDLAVRLADADADAVRRGGSSPRTNTATCGSASPIAASGRCCAATTARWCGRSSTRRWSSACCSASWR